MNHPYTPYLDWIDTQEQRLLDRVKQWVEINTFSSNLKGLAHFIQLLQQEVKPLNGDMQRLDLPPHLTLTSQGQVISQPGGQALTIRKRPQAPIQVLLAGHMDTVHSPTSPFQTIEEQGAGIWKGPGIADMKGGLAILLTTLEAIERSPFASQLGWEVLFTPDEEIGSPGSAPLYEAAAPRHQIGLIFEPAFPDGAFVSRRKGSVNYKLVVHGRAAHVGRDFAHGRSAVFALARFICAVESFNTGDLTLNVATVESPGAPNIIPHLASCSINLRSFSRKTLEEASHRLEQLAQYYHEQEGLQVQFAQQSFNLPKSFDDQTQKLFEGYESCAKELNIPFHTRETGGACDGNVLANAGLPTLDTAGVIGGALHTPHEYLILSSLVERAKLATLFLLKLAAGEIALKKGELS